MEYYWKTDPNSSESHEEQHEYQEFHSEKQPLFPRHVSMGFDQLVDEISNEIPLYQSEIKENTIFVPSAPSRDSKRHSLDKIHQIPLNEFTSKSSELSYHQVRKSPVIGFRSSVLPNPQNMNTETSRGKPIGEDHDADNYRFNILAPSSTHLDKINSWRELENENPNYHIGFESIIPPTYPSFSTDFMPKEENEKSKSRNRNIVEPSLMLLKGSFLPRTWENTWPKNKELIDCSIQLVEVPQGSNMSLASFCNNVKKMGTSKLLAARTQNESYSYSLDINPLSDILTREDVQEHITKQNPKFHIPEDPKEKKENLILSSERPARVFTKTSHSQGKDHAVGKPTGLPTINLVEKHRGTKTFFKKFSEMNWPLAIHPLNKSFIRDNKWKKTDETQEKRRSFLREFCKKYSGVSRPQSHLFPMVSRMYVEDKHKVLYCEVPKAGCSNWKRILMVLNGLAPSAYNISHDAVHYGKHLKKLDSFDLKGIHTRLNTYTKAVFVRDPMERLVSAFRDKFEHPNSYYHPVFGKAIIKKYRPNACEEALNNGSGVRFKEFVHYLLDSHRPVGMDIHWEKVSKLCYPCLIDYDFVGKFETLEEDANYFLQLIGAPKELKFPNFKDRHSSDERTNAQVVRQYLQHLTRTERQLIYDFYYLDYLMFNYTTPVL